jgi:hypothetical protein
MPHKRNISFRHALAHQVVHPITSRTTVTRHRRSSSITYATATLALPRPLEYSLIIHTLPQQQPISLTTPRTINQRILAARTERVVFDAVSLRSAGEVQGAVVGRADGEAE